MTMDNSNWKLYIKCLVLALAVSSCASQGCSYERMTQCKEGLRWNSEKRISDMNRQDVMSHCYKTRDDFNCLLRETRCLTDTERQRNAATLQTALRHIKDGCNVQGGRWQDSTCFLGSGIKDCENSNPLGVSSFSSFNTESCRKYQQFHDCVQDIVRNRCHQEDERLIGLYLMDTAQDMAWNCTQSDYDSDRYGGRRDSTDRYGGSSDRDRYGGSDRDRYGGSSYDRSAGGSNRNNDRGYDRGYDRNDRGYDRGNDRNSPSYGSNGDITCCRNERCDKNRMQMCRDSVSRAIDDRGFQDNQKCRKARDDFNCLLWQNSCLNSGEKDRNNDIIHRAQDFFRKNCDTYGRWNENSCYKSRDMQRCENYLSNTRSGADYEACRSYNNFRECAMQELQNRCTREDEVLQGSYFIDKAQELAWMCNSDRMDDRNVYYPGDRRGQYDRRNDYPPFGPSDDSYTQLDDNDSMCVSRVRYRKDGCERELNETRRRLLTEDNYDIKQKRRCCSAREYKTCLSTAVEQVCPQGGSRRVVEHLLGQARYELESSNCRYIYDSECSGSSSVVATLVLVLLGIFSVFFVSNF